jgi:hypothetical protein
MKQLLLFAFLFITIALRAQQTDQLPPLPSTKEEFVNTEKDFIVATKWLDNTAVGTNDDKRAKTNAWVTAWLINSPSVTIEIRSSILKIFDKNPQLNIVYMAAYGRYCLENNYSKDQLKCNTAGIRAAINCFKLGGDVKTNKHLNKAIDKEKEGMLEEWVNEAMKAK